MGFSNPGFFCSERLVSCIKRRKSFFHDLFSRSMTWEYIWLQGVTGGYKGLQDVTRGYRALQGITGGRLLFCIKRRKPFFHDLFSRSMTWEYRRLPGVTGGYKGLQGVTGGNKALQGVTKDYRNFFLTTTFPDSFSWSILQKNRS